MPVGTSALLGKWWKRLYKESGFRDNNESILLVNKLCEASYRKRVSVDL